MVTPVTSVTGVKSLYEKQWPNGQTLTFAATSAHDADLSTLQAPEAHSAAQQSITALPWSWLRQVHSDRVLVASTPGQHCGAVGDALATTSPEAVIGVQVADCGPVGLFATSVESEAPAAFGVAHAGWRGALVGVIEATARTVRALSGSDELHAVIGPHICVDCYEFGQPDLDTMATRFGADVVGQTSGGSPALDMRKVITSELRRLAIDVVASTDDCTACTPGYWSHRARQESGRQAMVAVLSDQPTPLSA